MVEKKLEITKILEQLALEGNLENRVAILNLPSANFCEKRGERIFVSGRLQQSCLGCVTQGIISRGSLGIQDIKKVIDFFSKEYKTCFITINGRGDPFNPKLKEDNLEKIHYAYNKYGIRAYVFTAGNNLDERTCQALADTKSTVMISLFGNRFIDKDFFSDKKYPSSPKPLQDQKAIADNLKRLIRAYKENPKQPIDGTTRIGMNYVVSERDLADYGERLKCLKQAANENGIFFVVNTMFQKNPDDNIQKLLEQLAHEYSDFHLRHSTAVNGQCQMGAGSSATLDYDGMLLRCPYMDNSKGDGKFQELSDEKIKEIIGRYMVDRKYPCVMRPHQK